MGGLIVLDEGAELRFVTQPDHAHFAAELMSLWRLDEMPEHRRRDGLLYAIREHDNGWQEADAAPRVDPETGRPHDFISTPEPDRLQIWKRGTDRFGDSRPYVSLLIAEHAEQLHPDRDQEWRELFDQLSERRLEWLLLAGLDAETIRRDYRYLSLADTCSLAVCRGRSEAFECSGTRGRLSSQNLALEPFPLAGETTFEVPCRRIPNVPYSTDLELGRALARARWQTFATRVVPA